MAKIGFIGLGVMGSQMVNRLLSKGHSVTGYNRTRAKAQWLVEKGMKWADSPRAVASASDFTFTMVTNAAAIAVHHGGTRWASGGPERWQDSHRYEHSESHSKPRAGR